MTEAEWLACADPTPMLNFLRGKASDRKLRLFAVACCRRLWHVLTDSRHSVELAERFAEGRSSLAELEDAREEAELIWSDPEFGENVARQHSFRGYSTLWSSDEDAVEVAEHCVQMMAAEAGASSIDLGKPECAAQSDLLRCIFGNAVRPLSINPAWLTPTVLALAQAGYDSRRLPCGTLDKDRFAVLADALEEVGCTDADLLNHCRGPGPHVRGCWLIDLLLRRT